MILTHELIHSAFNAGSPNRHQCKMLGIKYPLPGGWLKALAGKEVTQEWFDELSSLRRKRTPNEKEKESILNAVFAPLDETAETLRTDAKTAWDRAWAIYPQVNVEDGQARVAFIAGYLAGLAEGRKQPENLPPAAKV